MGEEKHDATVRRHYKKGNTLRRRQRDFNVLFVSYLAVSVSSGLPEAYELNARQSDRSYDKETTRHK